MIDHAIDQEELGDLQRMILEEADLTFAEKDSLSTYLIEKSKDAPDLRASK